MNEIKSDVMKKLKGEKRTNTQTIHYKAGVHKVEGGLFGVLPLLFNLKFYD